MITGYFTIASGAALIFVLTLGWFGPLGGLAVIAIFFTIYCLTTKGCGNPRSRWIQRGVKRGLRDYPVEPPTRSNPTRNSQ